MIDVLYELLVEQRWKEACERPDIARWKSLETFANTVADSIEKNRPNHISVTNLRGIATKAQCRMLEMIPKEVSK
jgi:hypothetical protein